MRPCLDTSFGLTRSGSEFDGSLRSCHPGDERAWSRPGGGQKFGHTCHCGRRQPVGLWERTAGRTGATLLRSVWGSGRGRAEVERAGWGRVSAAGGGKQNPPPPPLFTVSWLKLGCSYATASQPYTAGRRGDCRYPQTWPGPELVLLVSQTRTSTRSLSFFFF